MIVKCAINIVKTASRIFLVRLGNPVRLCPGSALCVIALCGGSYAATAADKNTPPSSGPQVEAAAPQKGAEPQKTGEPQKRAEPKFNIWEFAVQGTKLIQPEAIENVLTPFLGPDKTFSEVEQASHAIEKLYRDSGYPVVVVDIPEQDVVGGKIKLKVTEGVVGKIKVAGSKYFLLSDIKNRVPSLSEGSSLYIPDLQKDLNKLNALSSDLRVTPLLKEGETPGSVNVELKVKDKLPMHGEIEYNNHASANTTATRLSASISYDNLWSKFHSFSLMMQVTPEKTDEIRVLVGTYILPLEDSTSRLALYGVYSDSQIGEVVEVNGIKVIGNSQVAGMRYVKPMNYSADFQHVLTLGVDYKDSSTETNIKKGTLAQPDILVDQTELSFAVLSAEYKATWRKPKNTTQLGGGVYFGLRNGVNKTSEFEYNRYDSEANFIYWKAFAQRNTNLPVDFSLVNKFKLQHTESSLVSNEQISIGGMTSVRGYFESQTMGDRGAISSLELYTPKLLQGWKKISDLKVFTFVEGGAVEVLNALPDQKNNFLLASAGVGLEFSTLKNINAELSLAFPLKDACSGICGQAISDVEEGQSHTSFSLTYKY